MKQSYRKRLLGHFLPFMILVIGGSFFLREFTKIRYKYRKIESYDIKKEVEAHGIRMKKPVSLEEEYEKIKQTVDLDNWENVRIPRPWEEPTNANN